MMEENVSPSSGKVRFTKEMTVAEVLQKHPLARQVLMEFNLGGCAHCSISSEETLEQVCYAYGLPLDTIIDTLNSLPEETQVE